jgi:cobalt/nickel transport system ATP-binding protein
VVTVSHGATAALELTGVAFRYPDGHVGLDGVDLRIDAGERVAVLGPNGSGKTTLVLHLNGILRPQAGRVVVGGIEVSSATVREVRRLVGIVFQDPDDQLFMPTVADDVAFGPGNLGLEGVALDRAVAGALAAVGLEALGDRPPHHLSFGQKRRACIATVLSMEPELLVLDEPTSNLDPVARRELADLVRALDRTTLVVTHDLLHALEVCDRSVILDGGRVVADGPTAELLADVDLLARHRLELPRGVHLSADRLGS